MSRSHEFLRFIEETNTKNEAVCGEADFLPSTDQARGRVKSL